MGVEVWLVRCITRTYINMSYNKHLYAQMWMMYVLGSVATLLGTPVQSSTTVLL